MSISTRKIQRYGWRPDLPDFRDFLYRDYHSPHALKLRGPVVAPVVVTPHDDNTTHLVVNTNVLGNDGLPLAVSLRSKMPPIFNQGQLGSCTANAGAAMWAFAHGGGPYSRLQIYYCERMIEGNVDSDSGAFIRDCIQVLVKTGAGLEADWPYVEANFTQCPPAIEMAEAAQCRATEYSRLMSRADFRNCLAQGHPFCVGITVYSSFESDEVARTGIVPMPSQTDQLMGGHAVCVIGYNTDFHGRTYYEVRNSWGADWGDQGHFWLPAEYLENEMLSQDAWTVRK